MVFSSLTFLYAYLPAVLLAYFAVPQRFRNTVLLLVSLFFYGWGEPVYILVMMGSILFNWLAGFAIDRCEGKKKKLLLVLCIVCNLLALGFFKYWDFLAANLRAVGFRKFRLLRLGLPIGISFYTFQTMSYPIDLYRNKTTVQKNLIDFGAYVCMFPQLIAGPIVRYVEIAGQLRERKITVSSFSQGICRFICGLAKKVLLANQAGAVFEEVSALPVTQQSVLTAWLGIICFAFQIYFDFSGYSDMAVGLGHMLGFSFPENFNYPYTARSLTDFWRRWHMTLSYWFRDYVYIPLGGNRKGLGRQIINILIVWTLTGFWHGASWNFVLWGLFYGILLILEKCFLLKILNKLPAWLCHVYTMAAVLLAWVLFSFTDLSQAIRYLALLFGSSGRLFHPTAFYYFRDNLVLLAACFLGCTPFPSDLYRRSETLQNLTPLLCVTGLLVCTACIVSASYNPFLYFRF